MIYLNSGTHSLTPRPILDAIARYELEYEENPTAHLMRAWDRLWTAQKRLGTFLNADPKCLFLRQNVTEAMNAFILGVPLPMGSEILLSDMEYQAVENICRYRAERDGLTIRKFPLPFTADQLRPETGLLVLSHVLTGTGAILPIAEIAAQTRAQGVLLAVDGAHAAGALDLDFRTLANVDFYGSNLHKWMMGPKGTGFGWVSPRHHETLRPLEAGWATFESPNDYAAFGDGARFPAKMLMQGCRNFAPFFAIDDTLAFWEKTGAGKIRARIRELQRHLEAELKWPLLSPALDGGARGPLTTYELPAHLEKEGYALMSRILEQHDLQVGLPRVLGRSRLRLSPHIYNTEDEISRAVAILKSL
ncbi:MAG: aminotransferase class V-fold PLP-dependent enzyme [Elusimicrobiota bacterium]